MQAEARADDASTRTSEAIPSPRRFGEAGDVVVPTAGVTPVSTGGGLGGSVGFVWIAHSSTPDGYGNRLTQTDVAMQPELDVFVARHVSIGGSVSLGYSHFASEPSPTPGTDTLEAGIAPRVGIVFPLGDKVALWPRVGLRFGALDLIKSDGNYNPAPYDARATVDAALVYSLDRHFYVSFDPTVSVGGFPRTAHYDSSFSTVLETSFSAGFVL